MDAKYVNLLYKQVQGVPFTNSTTLALQEQQGKSTIKIQPSQIWNQEIPLEAPTSTTTTILRKAVTNIYLATKNTNAAYSYIVNYTNVLLIDTPYKNNSYYYKDTDLATFSTSNILVGAIPSNQDSVNNTYKVRVYYSLASDGTGLVEIPSNSTSNPWHFDGNSGYLTFFTAIDPNNNWSIYISFWRYEGWTGFGSSGTGPTGLTGATGPTGWTGPTGSNNLQDKMFTVLTNFIDTTAWSQLTLNPTATSYTGSFSAMSGSGQYRIVISHASQLLITSVNYGKTWSTSPNTLNFLRLSMSVSGQYQTAITLNSIYVSSNYGSSFSLIDGTGSFFTITVSATGQFQFVTTSSYIKTSNDYGTTWSNNTSSPASIEFSYFTISSTGKYQVALHTSSSDGIPSIYCSMNSGITWRPISNITNINWTALRMSETGDYMIALSASFSYISNDYGSTWTQNLIIKGSLLAINSTGQYITRYDASNLYSSLDFGKTWVAVTNLDNLNSIQMSVSGEYQIAIRLDEILFTKNSYGPVDSNIGSAFSSDDLMAFADVGSSINLGTEWTRVTGVPNQIYYGVAMSSSGQYQTATSTLGIYTSIDFGATWGSASTASTTYQAAIQTPPYYVTRSGGTWNGIAVSGSGQYQTVLLYSSSLNIKCGIYRTSVFGKGYLAFNLSLNINKCKYVDMSFSGKYQTVLQDTGIIYNSFDYGITWNTISNIPPTSVWSSISISASGKYQIAGSNSGFYTSDNYGITWVSNYSNYYQFTAVGLSSSGQYQVAYGTNKIMVSYDFGITWINQYNSYFPSQTEVSNLSISASGQYQIFSYGNVIACSIDYGHNFTTNAQTFNCAGLAMSKSGQYQTIVTSDTDGDIYTISNILSIPGNLTVGSLSFADSNMQNDKIVYGQITITNAILINNVVSQPHLFPNAFTTTPTCITLSIKTASTFHVIATITDITTTGFTTSCRATTITGASSAASANSYQIMYIVIG